MRRLPMLSVEMMISTPERNDIMQMASLLKLEPITESNGRLYGKHTFGLENVTPPLASFESFSATDLIKRISDISAVGRPVWSYLWDDTNHIPLSWCNNKLVFGEIFKNGNGGLFLLVFIFNNKWDFSFEKLEDILLFSQNAVFVSLAEQNND